MVRRESLALDAALTLEWLAGDCRAGALVRVTSEAAAGYGELKRADGE